VHDLVIRGGTVVDGTGAPAYGADVAIDGGRISAIGPAVEDGRDTIEADGLVVAPGFVDMHSHSDLVLLEEPHAEAKVAQGVTLEVLGQDGLSCAPVEDRATDLVASLIAPLDGTLDREWPWRTVAEYLDLLDRRTAVNVAYLAPHGTIRATAMGMADREATPAELDHMRRLVRDAMADGAFGLSTALTYRPSQAAPTTEVSALCSVVADAGGIYVTHLRDYDGALFEATVEALEIGRMSGTPVHISHFQAPGARNMGRAPELLRVLEDARSGGLDTTFDVYPYTAGSTSLLSFCPFWFQGLEPGDALAVLDGPRREQLVSELRERPAGIDLDWSAFTVAQGAEWLPDSRFPNLADAAERSGTSVGEVIVGLLEGTRLHASTVLECMDPADVRACLAHRLATVSSDGLLIGERPHPRAWGAFAETLGTFVRGEGLLTLESAIHAMSGRAASRLGLHDRGTIARGSWADVAVFDPARVAARATYSEPRRLAVGVELVLVNGVVVLRDGASTGALPGRALRGAGAT
jgi:N-acyl-D-amino-acid deacylase